MSMMSTARTNLRGRLGVLIAGSLVFTALTAGAAAASVPTSMGGKDVRLSRHGARVSPTTSRMTGSSTRPRTPVPGFLLDRGRYTTFDAPKAGIETDANSINNHGQIVGAYIEDDADATYHGFLRDARGLFTTIDLPGARATVVSRINDRGQVVGYTLAPTEADPLAGARGFLLAKGVKGPFTPIVVPGAPRNLVFGLNDRGQIVGAYSDTAVVLEPPRSSSGASCWRAASSPGSTPPARSAARRSASTTAAKWSASTSTPPAATTAMCGSGVASRRSTCPAPPGPPPSRSTTVARSPG
jgi:hypothetical protein